jgi:predicted RNA-binding protein with TRAM domain
MKTLLFLCATLILPSWGIAQSFLNGSFENNSAVGCNYNLSDDNFNLLIEHVTAFGMEFNLGGYIGECDLQTFGCFVNPAEGDWCVGLATEDTEETGDAIALELSSPLTVGETYEVTLQAFGNTEFTDGFAIFEIGETVSDTSFGNMIYINQTTADEWTNYVFTFTATVPATHISARVFANQYAWMQVDDFTISRASSIQVNNGLSSQISLFPNPASDWLQLQLESPAKNSKIIIYNAQGQIVHQQVAIQLTPPRIDIRNWPKGAYFVRVESWGRTSTRQFLKD